MKHFLTVSFIIVFLTTPVLKAEEALRFAPASAWVKVIDYSTSYYASDVDNGAVYLLIDNQINFATNEEFYHSAIQITTETGVENYSDFWIDYQPEYQHVTIHNIVVHRNGETISKLAKDEFKTLHAEEDLDRHMFNGTVSSGYYLNDIRTGDILEYAYTLSGYNPVFENNRTEQLQFQYNIPLKKIYRSIEYNNDAPVHLIEINNPPKAKLSKGNGTTRMTWEVTNPSALLVNNNTPSWYSPYPQVIATTFASWADIKTWGKELFPEFMVSIHDSRLRNIFNQQDIESKIDSLINFVQDDIRYVGIEIGMHSHKPHNPDQIIKRGYGDCKDKSYLLSCLLQQVGVKASVALVSSYLLDKAELYGPSPYAFNHAIVTYNFEGKDYWVDPTVTNQHGFFKNLYLFDYKKGLVLNNNDPGLTALPHQGDERIIIEEHIVCNDTTKPTRYTVTTTYFGGEADRIRQNLSNSSQTELNNSYLNFYSKIYPQLRFAQPLKKTDFANENKFVVKEDYFIDGFWEPSGPDDIGELHCNVFPANLEYYITDTDERNRTTPLYFYHPVKIKHTIAFEHFKDVTIDKTKQRITNNAFDLTFKITQPKSNTVVFDFDYATKQDYVELASLQQYFADIDNFNNIASYQFSLGNVEATSKNTDINRWSILFGLILTGSFIVIIRQANKLKTQREFLPQQKTITGWLWIIGVSLIISSLVITYQLFNLGFYRTSTWETMSNLAEQYQNKIWQVAFVYEFFINHFFITFLVFLIILFFKRRNIFPVSFIIFRVAHVVFIMGDIIIQLQLDTTGSSGDFATVKPLVQSFIGACIWIPIVYYSELVKQTFTIPYTDTKQRDDIGSVFEKRANEELTNLV